MKIVVMLDDKNGMTFNRRRQSRDSALTARLPALAGDGVLWMNTYSAALFADGLPAGAVCDDGMLDKAGENDLCIVENLPLAPYADRIGTVYVARWNRTYPSDRKLDIDLFGRRETLVEEFAGTSHDKITLLRYDRP